MLVCLTGASICCFKCSSKIHHSSYRDLFVPGGDGEVRKPYGTETAYVQTL